uniref:HDC17319 n=1 Tax=Drosophila melanogaster TaxID=7227 RepID=Q6IIR0_DROME|nr:TPA_inf: HDC17319 [Drosophila melanogaster]
MPCQDSPPALFPRFLLILIKLERQRRRWGCWMNWQRRRRRNSISQDKGSHQEETTGYGYTYAFCSFCSCSSSSDKLPLNPPKSILAGRWTTDCRPRSKSLHLSRRRDKVICGLLPTSLLREDILEVLRKSRPVSATTFPSAFRKTGGVDGEQDELQCADSSDCYTVIQCWPGDEYIGTSGFYSENGDCDGDCDVDCNFQCVRKFDNFGKLSVGSELRTVGFWTSGLHRRSLRRRLLLQLPYRVGIFHWSGPGDPKNFLKTDTNFYQSAA